MHESVQRAPCITHASLYVGSGRVIARVFEPAHRGERTARALLPHRALPRSLPPSRGCAAEAVCVTMRARQTNGFPLGAPWRDNQSSNSTSQPCRQRPGQHCRHAGGGGGGRLRKQRPEPTQRVFSHLWPPRSLVEQRRRPEERPEQPRVSRQPSRASRSLATLLAGGPGSVAGQKRS